MDRDEVTRRRFVGRSARRAAGAGLIAALPPLAAGCGDPLSSSVEPTDSWPVIAQLSEIPDDTYGTRTAPIEGNDGRPHRVSIYLRRRNREIDRIALGDERQQVIAVSPRCTHLGCPVRFVEPSAVFICPCHGGSFDVQGRKKVGPPVRGLDRFYTVVREGEVRIGPQYSISG